MGKSDYDPDLRGRKKNRCKRHFLKQLGKLK